VLKRRPLAVMLLSSCLSATAFAGAAPVGEKTTAPAGEDADGLAAGRELTRQLYEGQLDEVYTRLSDDFRTEMTREQLAATRQSIVDRLGAEQRVTRESARIEGEYLVYRRHAAFSGHDGTIEVVWAFRPDGKVGGFFVRDLADAPPGGSR